MQCSHFRISPVLLLATLATASALVGCQAPSAVAPGMVAGPQDADYSFKGMPGDAAAEQSIPGGLPQGAGYNQKPGELRPQMAGDVHYHVHYHGAAADAGGPDGFAQPQYGAPRRNGNLGRYNQGQRQAPLGTGGGGAGWYGPDRNSSGGPYGGWGGAWHGGWGAWGGAGINSNFPTGWHGGWTD